MANFSIDISEWVRTTNLRGTVVMRSLGLQALSGILKRSPVKTGRFRASNRVALNTTDPTVEPPRPEGSLSSLQIGAAPTAAELATGAAKIASADWGDTIVLSNNLPYARALENGSSRQTGNQPDGIYGATFSELRANLEAAIAKARGLT